MTSTKMDVDDFEEVKFLDITNVSGTGTQDIPTSVTPMIIPLNIIEPGDQFSNRDGRKVTLKKLNVKLAMYNIDHHPTAIRVLIVVDKQANGTLSSLHTVLQIPVGEDGGISDVLAHANLFYEQRYCFLVDDIVSLESNFNSRGDGTAEEGTRWEIQEYEVDLNNLNTMYQSDTNTISDISSNAVNLIIFRNGAPLPPTDIPQVRVNSRIRFTG